MADELDPVTQTFEADVAEYVAAVEEAAAQAQEFATANDEAKVAVDGVRDSATEAGAAMAEIGAGAAGAGDALGHVRDEALEASAGLKAYKDAEGSVRDSSAEFILAATADALALGHERDEALLAAEAVKKLRDAKLESDAAGGGGLLSGLFGGGGGGGGGSAVPLLGPLIDSPELLAAIVPAVGAVVTEVGALATGLVAAGLGIGSFAALAMPAFSQVFNALGDTKAKLEKLPEPVQQAVGAVKQLEDGFKKMSKAFEPTALKALNEGLKIANQLLPYVGQFANAAAPAIEQLLGGLSKAIDSPSFKKFMDFLSSLAGPVITAIGSGMAGLGKDVMQLMESFSKKDVVNAINIAFRLLGAALTILIGIIKGSMATWDWITQKALPAVRDAFDTTRHAIATAGHDIASAFDTVRHAVATAGHDIASAFDTVRHTVASWGHDIASAFDRVRHDIVAALDAVINWVKSNWKDILGWLLLPVLMAAGEIYTHTHQIAQAFDQLRHDVAAILDGMRHDIATGFDAARHLTAQALDNIRHDIATAWDNIRHDVAARVDAIPHDIATGWDAARHLTAQALDNIRHDIASGFDSIRHDIASWIDDVLAFFRRLPGEITGFLAKLPGEMVTIGVNIIHGLINGIESQGSILANAIVSLIPSPIRSLVSAALGIFSPSTVFHGYGVNLVQGLINGVQSMQPHLRTAMTGLAGGVTGIGSSLAAGAIGAAGGSTTVHVPVQVTAQGMTPNYNDPKFTQYIQGVVQEGVLRYGQLNPHNGLTSAWSG